MQNALEAAPQIFVLGGPNGAGKSTTAQVLLPHTLGVNQFVNADLIAREISPAAPYSVDYTAAEIMLQRIHALLGRRESLGFETTLASRSYASLLTRARLDGYVVSIVYAWLSSVDLAISRVNDRVREGGHGIPADTIRRRYHRSLSNFFGLYRALVDSWTLCDNSGQELVVVAQGVSGYQPVIQHSERYAAILESVKHED